VQGFGVIGLGAEDVTVPPRRMVQEPKLVFLQAEAEVVVHGAALRIKKEEGGMKTSFLLPPFLS
jgi:hypothetical protein